MRANFIKGKILDKCLMCLSCKVSQSLTELQCTLMCIVVL